MADNAHLLDVWEWDYFTGDPFTPPLEVPNARYCPTPEQMREFIHGQIVISENIKQAVYDFMSSGRTTSLRVFDAESRWVARSYLRFLRCLDFKKVSVSYDCYQVKIKKLPRDTPFTGEPDGINHFLRYMQRNNYSELARDICHNALLGWNGPGTFPCWHRQCELCTKVGRTPTVNLGPFGELHLMKRASCSSKNTVYVGVCQECENHDEVAIYVGESSLQLRKRCKGHRSGANNPRSPLRRLRSAEQQRAEVALVIAAGEDPEEVLRDWFSHITERGIHPGQEKMSVVAIHEHSLKRKIAEMRLVEERMFINGDIDYRGRGHGCLNTYHDTD